MQGSVVHEDSYLLSKWWDVHLVAQHDESYQQLHSDGRDDIDIPEYWYVHLAAQHGELHLQLHA